MFYRLYCWSDFRGLSEFLEWFRTASIFLHYAVFECRYWFSLKKIKHFCKIRKYFKYINKSYFVWAWVLAVFFHTCIIFFDFHFVFTYKLGTISWFMKYKIIDACSWNSFLIFTFVRFPRLILVAFFPWAHSTQPLQNLSF